MYVCMPYAWTLRHLARGDQLKTIVNSISNLSGPGTCLQSNPLYTKYITSETPHRIILYSSLTKINFFMLMSKVLKKIMIMCSAMIRQYNV